MTLKQCITEVCEVKTKHGITPEQNRYVDKEARNTLKLVIGKQSKRLPDFLTPPEIYKFLETAGKSPQKRLIAEMLIFTGLRISELNNLDIRDVQFDNNQVKVREGKGGKDRYVPITNSLLHKLRLYIGNRDKGYIFVNNKGTQYCKRMLQHMMEQVIIECNFAKQLSTHSLRHTFACLCLAKGIRIEDIKLLMGHSSIKTTEIYAKLELGSIKEHYLQIMGEA